MAIDLAEVRQSWIAIQAEFRKLPMLPTEGRPPLAEAAARGPLSLLRAAMARPLGGPAFGCRLFHWNPELEQVRVDAVCEGRPVQYGIYFSHLTSRVGGKPHAHFHKLHKAAYAEPGSAGPNAERQFGVTYSDLVAKSETKPHLDAIKKSATEAGALIALVRDRLASVLPAATLFAKNDLHRWIFTVYDIAWRNPPDSPLSATKYIPIEGMNEFLGTNERIVYDLERVRATPWSDVERGWEMHRRRDFAHFKEAYASWGETLPVYFASRIDDFVRASDLAIDWLAKQLESP